jgi:hypothetical protein
MNLVSADGLMWAALALRAKCRFSAKRRKTVNSWCVDVVIAFFAI